MAKLEERGEVARRLARRHAEFDGGIRIVRRIDQADDSPYASVTLLEVNEHAVPSGTIVAIPFGPSGDIPLSTTVVELTPDEYEMLEQGRLMLPEGWHLAEELFRR